MSRKVAVIGVGALGRHHARIYSELDNVELAAVVDVERDRAEELATACGCTALESVRELGSDVEAVSLAVPTETHAEIAVPLLEAGVHVLVEKPIAADLRQADRMLEAREKGGGVLHVGHSERFNPAFAAVRPVVKKPLFFETHRLAVFVPRSLDVDVVADLMIHDLDLLQLMVGEPVVDIRAVGIPVLTGRVDIANARLEFEGGCVANVTASRVSRERVRKLRFFQKSDYVSIDLQSRTVDVLSLEFGPQGPSISERAPTAPEREPLRGEIEAFLGQIDGVESEVACDGAAGRQSLSLALAIIREMGR